MKLWMSGEIQSTVSAAYTKTYKSIEPLFNEFFKDKFYGNGLVEIAYIAIIRPIELDGSKEVKRYHKKDRDVEFRLKIAHDEFLHADEKTQLRMVADSIMQAIKLIPELKNIPDFDYDTFKQDATKLWQENGWLSDSK